MASIPSKGLWRYLPIPLLILAAFVLWRELHGLNLNAVRHAMVQWGPGRSLAALLLSFTVYGFLADTTPLAALAPEHTILIDSLSKRVAPGLTIGMLVAPPGLGDRLGVSLRQGGWTAAGFSLAAGVHWMSQGDAERLAAIKRIDAAERQAMARTILTGFDLVGDPRAYHLWLRLPDLWRAEAYVTAAFRRGLAIIPASAFAISPGHAQNAVRIALASPPRDET